MVSARLGCVADAHAERTAELWPRTVPGPGVDVLRDSLLLTLSPLPPSHSLTPSPQPHTAISFNPAETPVG